MKKSFPRFRSQTIEQPLNQYLRTLMTPNFPFISCKKRGLDLQMAQKNAHQLGSFKMLHFSNYPQIASFRDIKFYAS